MKLFKNLTSMENAIASSLLEGACREITGDKIKFTENHPKNSLLSAELIVESAENILKVLNGGK